MFLLHHWQVEAIDFSPAAVAHAREMLGPLGASVREADFFGQELDGGQFDIIYERAFLCALPIKLRPAWAERVAMLLPRGSKLIGFFYFDSTEKGPPFGISDDALCSMLANDFERLQNLTPTDSIPVFAGKERWQVWQKR